jgi:superfamily II DNA or RNA helicase
MDKYFITNRSRVDLKTRIEDILSNSKSLDILVGYFYWSGFFGLYKNLEGKKIRILVGMEVDARINQMSQELDQYDFELSPLEIRKKYFRQEKDRIAKSLDLENPDSQEAFCLYLEMIRSGNLEIRKTREPNHAKLYIFYNDDTTSRSHGKGQIITGSSNLTYSGISGREEINVNLKDDYVVDQSGNIFEDLWEKSTTLVNKENVVEFETEVVEKTFLGAKPSPFEFYLRTLIEIFDTSNKEIISPSQITSNSGRSFDDLRYQTDAIKEAIKKIEIHSGVIIADVVGLGKSIIASTVAHNLGLKTVVIAPPHLNKLWQEYSEDFNFRAQNSIYSSGKIAEAYYQESKNRYKKLIIIDEAHKYRNEDTDDHKYLTELCRGHKVVLLTATPYNNSPKDLKALLKLFQIEGSPTIQGLDNVFNRFTELQIDYDKLKKQLKTNPKSDKKTDFQKIAEDLKSMIEPVLIRRSRLDLQNIDVYAQELGEKINLAKVSEPKLIKYELGSWEGLYLKTLQKIAPDDQESEDKISRIKKGFKGVRYSPASYIKNWETRRKELEEIFGDFETAQIAGKNLAKLMKSLLIRRFESSLGAFRASLNNYIKTHENILKWYDKGYVPIFKKGNLESPEEYLEFEEALESSQSATSKIDESIKNELSKKGIYLIPADNFLSRAEIHYKNDLEKDLKLLKSILDDWKEENLSSDDPKLEKVYQTILNLRKENPQRKILIFSSFADTVNYVSNALHQKGLRVLNYSSAVSGESLRRIVRQNFDAGLEEVDQADDYDILVATDAISEGYNLHRAGVLINYDIPYNPTRVIQRLGRINRINRKVFDSLEIYNFFPSIVGKREGLRTEEVSILKMSMIHSILGEDVKVLRSDETEELQTFISSKIKESEQEDHFESWEVEHRNVLEKYRNTDHFSRAKEIPDKTRIRRIVENKELSLIFVRKNKQVYFQSLRGGQIQNMSLKESLEYLKSSPEQNEESLVVSDEFKNSYFGSINTLYSTSSKNILQNSFSIQKKNNNWNKAKLFVRKLRENSTNLSQEEMAYLDKLRSLIDDFRAISQKDLKEMIRLGESNKDLKELQELLPEKQIYRLHQICRDIQNEPKTVVLIQEIQSQLSN